VSILLIAILNLEQQKANYVLCFRTITASMICGRHHDEQRHQSIITYFCFSFLIIDTTLSKIFSFDKDYSVPFSLVTHFNMSKMDKNKLITLTYSVK